ncbi:CDP-alcohol phosphatidyltransferase family protein [bacterium]|nr:CDP-alcohol phosphatidyltransferase family protein [bacterium]
MNAKDLKPAVLAILRPLTGALIRSRIHPNTLSYAGLAVSIAAAWVYGMGPLVTAALLLLVAGVFDLLDGAVAREGQRMSRFGAFLDSNLDRYAEIVVFVGILWRFQGEMLTQTVAVLAITGSLMVSYTKARAEGLGQEVSGGMLQRPERIVLLALGSFFQEGGLRVVLWILAVFTNLTSVQRMVLVAKSMRQEENPPTASDRSDVSVEARDIEPAPPPA